MEFDRGFEAILVVEAIFKRVTDIPSWYLDRVCFLLPIAVIERVVKDPLRDVAVRGLDCKTADETRSMYPLPRRRCASLCQTANRPWCASALRICHTAAGLPPCCAGTPACTQYTPFRLSPWDTHPFFLDQPSFVAQKPRNKAMLPGSTR